MFSLFSRHKPIMIENAEKNMFRQAEAKLRDMIYMPSDPTNFSRRLDPQTKISAESDELAASFVDTFIIHDPGFYHFGNTEKDKQLRNILPKRKLQITLDEMTKPNKKKSAHFTMDYDGTIYEHVPLYRRAWHAGVSHLYGRDNLNTTSIGIEILEPFKDFQYVSLAVLISNVQQTYALIDPTRIVGHFQVSPNRKSDPNGFNWWKLFDRIAKYRML